MDSETRARSCFAREETPVALIGGLALCAYGVDRTTYDVDLLTACEIQEALVEFLEATGEGV